MKVHRAARSLRAGPRTATPGPTHTYFTRCTRGGIAYVPLTTRPRSRDIYRCGDGTCQVTESRGVGLSTQHGTLDRGLCR